MSTTIHKPRAAGPKKNGPVKRLTIKLDQEIYDNLRKVAGRGRMSSFVETVLRPYVTKVDLAAEYKAMAEDTEREAEAHEWAEALIGDIADEPR